MKAISLIVTLLLFYLAAKAQHPGRSYAREAIRKNIERKMDSTYRKQGRKAVSDVTYENDKRFKDPNNKVIATLAFLDSSFKKERVKAVTGTAMVFGKHGEA